jgi:hypothetical protein
MWPGAKLDSTGLTKSGGEFYGLMRSHSQPLVLESGDIMNDTDNPSQRQETWHDDDHEYYTRLHVTLVVAGIENYPPFLSTVYWTVS